MSRSRVDWNLMLAALCATILACAAEEDPAATTARRCVALRDHLVDLRLQTQTEFVEEHRKALTESLGDGFLERCQDMPPEQIKCALAELSPEGVASCSTSTR